MKSDQQERNKLQLTGEQTTESIDQAELRVLFEEHNGMVYRAAYRVTGSSADAEDVLQTVFLRLLQPGRIEKIRHNPGAYLYRDYAAEADGDREVEQDELHRLLRRALLSLSPVESQVFVLKYFEECTNKEIGEILETTANSVNVALHKARGKLRKKLSTYMGRSL